MYSTPQPPAGPSRGRVALYGAITFALVFLLIIGAAVAYLVVRNLTSDGGDPTSGPSTSVSESVTSTDTATATPTEAEQHCWMSAKDRTTGNPSGKLAGGGLQMTAPALFTERTNWNAGLYFTDDEATAYGDVIPGSWQSSVTVGAVHWQDGYEYPGAEKAAGRIMDCMLSANVWGDKVSSKKETNRTTTEVTIGDATGYRVDLDYEFGVSKLTYPDGTTITASHLIIIVVDTESGPGFFAGEYPVGNADHQAAVQESLDSLAEYAG